MKTSLIILTFATSFMFSGFAAAQDTSEQLLSSWYGSLAPVDRDRIGDLLSNDAMIELKDYELTQSKDEFIESLDSWEDAIEGGSIKFKTEAGSSENSTTAIVCYSFPSNQLMTKELFEFANGQITKSVQSTLSEDCADF